MKSGLDGKIDNRHEVSCRPRWGLAMPLRSRRSHCNATTNPFQRLQPCDVTPRSLLEESATFGLSARPVGPRLQYLSRGFLVHFFN